MDETTQDVLANSLKIIYFLLIYLTEAIKNGENVALTLASLPMQTDIISYMSSDQYRDNRMFLAAWYSLRNAILDKAGRKRTYV